MARSSKASRHTTKMSQKKSHAKIKKQSTRAAVHGGSYRSVNKPKGW